MCPINHILPLSVERKVEFQSLHQATRTLQHKNHTRWKPLEPEVYKVNYDGATFADQRRAGIGVVIRNAEGVVMAALSQLILFQQRWLKWKRWQPGKQLSWL